MSDAFLKALEGHSALISRVNRSTEQLMLVKQKMEQAEEIRFLPIAVFVAGSIARGEIGTKSDLDVFVIADEKPTNLETHCLFGKIIQINDDLNFSKLSNDGEFLKVHTLKEMNAALGSREDDAANLFTTRMLLLLEGVPVCNAPRFDRLLTAIVGNYFRDASARNDFKPLFLLNDLLRFWRTLCLNYEQIRVKAKRPWRKKNINLKFSRMLTVFGTVLPLLVEDVNDEKVIELCSLRPMNRLANALDRIGDSALLGSFQLFLDNYEFFLSLKESDQIEQEIISNPSLKIKIDVAAAQFSDFLFECLTHESISPTLRKYLVI